MLSLASKIEQSVANLIQSFAGPTPTSQDSDLAAAGIALTDCTGGFLLLEQDYSKGPLVRCAVYSGGPASYAGGDGNNSTDAIIRYALRIVGVVGQSNNLAVAVEQIKLLEEVIRQHVLNNNLRGYVSDAVDGGMRSLTAGILSFNGVSFDTSASGQAPLKFTAFFTQEWLVDVEDMTSN
jgi:hypothetical protein